MSWDGWVPGGRGSQQGRDCGEAVRQRGGGDSHSNNSNGNSKQSGAAASRKLSCARVYTMRWLRTLRTVMVLGAPNFFCCELAFVLVVVRQECCTAPTTPRSDARGG